MLEDESTCWNLKIGDGWMAWDWWWEKSECAKYLIWINWLRWQMYSSGNWFCAWNFTVYIVVISQDFTSSNQDQSSMELIIRWIRGKNHIFFQGMQALFKDNLWAFKFLYLKYFYIMYSNIWRDTLTKVLMKWRCKFNYICLVFLHFFLSSPDWGQDT